MERFTTFFLGPPRSWFFVEFWWAEAQQTLKFLLPFELYIFRKGVPQIFGHQVVKHLLQVAAAGPQETSMGAQLKN